MAEEPTENPQPDAEENAIDWKAKYEAMKSHSREWEKKAKENQGAASELEKLKEEQLSEIEKAHKRTKEIENELSQLKATQERTNIVAQVASEAKISPEVIAMLNGADADELKSQIERILEVLPAYPNRSDDGGTGGAKTNKSKEDMFFEGLFPSN